MGIKLISVILIGIVVIGMGCVSESPKKVEQTSNTLKNLSDKWKTPVKYYMLIYSSYLALKNTADDLAHNKTSGSHALGEVVGTGIVLNAVKKSLINWTPNEGQETLKLELENEVEIAQGIIEKWMHHEIDSNDVKKMVDQELPKMNKTLIKIIDKMRQDGATNQDIANLFNEVRAEIGNLSLSH